MIITSLQVHLDFSDTGVSHLVMKVGVTTLQNPSQGVRVGKLNSDTSIQVRLGPLHDTKSEMWLSGKNVLVCPLTCFFTHDVIPFFWTSEQETAGDVSRSLVCGSDHVGQTHRMEGSVSTLQQLPVHQCHRDCRCGRSTWIQRRSNSRASRRQQPQIRLNCLLLYLLGAATPNL